MRNERTRRHASEFPKARRQIPEGEEGIQTLGHRNYVGGLWNEIGRLQFDFLIAQGLEPSHVLLDIGCGALRGGVHFISYLDAGNYLALEKEPTLVEIGLRRELPASVRAEKRPEIVVSDSFEFERLSKRPDYALAQSLFTHLVADDIARCLAKLAGRRAPGCRFFATFFEADEQVENPTSSHSRKVFCYTRAEILALGHDNGWSSAYIGDWGHPRGQVMVEYTSDAATPTA
jgi:hypothetical protein